MHVIQKKVAHLTWAVQSSYSADACLKFGTVVEEGAQIWWAYLTNKKIIISITENSNPMERPYT